MSGLSGYFEYFFSEFLTAIDKIAYVEENCRCAWLNFESN